MTIETIGTAAAFVLPFFNIPLILRLLKRKHSDDISLTWAIGVWVCTILMMPGAIRSSDLAYRVYGMTNVVFFSVVAFLVIYYHFKPGRRCRLEP